ncbi:ANTAR domain-containing protein [Streptomyces boncukensis]|uniref:ANTAR domain-containing protein n=1 Tax=Streptomyces boncukensis TaxID=2711219 RepID=A0A6G4WYE5_9ACTN|nr:ANTAR domain-containing protein [Streptomyces boncukensis]NGO69660.1 ANTAR domain-containing protein [Streptomyces boncukensis]
MLDRRALRALELVALKAGRRGGRADVRDVCAAAVETLPVDGVGISAMYTPALRHVLHTTDRISGELEELQLTLGEGPCVDAIVSGSPVLSGDLSVGELHARWPAFAPAAYAAGAHALFALPLDAGGGIPGVLDMYASRTGTLEGEALAEALAFADAATALLLLATAGFRTVEGPGPGAMEDVMGFDQYRAEIDQAVGMLTEQIGVGAEEAAVRLRAYAYAQSRKVGDIAVEVVARRLRFDPDGTTHVREEE